MSFLLSAVDEAVVLVEVSLGELEQWIKEIGAKWDEQLLRLKIFLEQEQTDE